MTAPDVNNDDVLATRRYRPENKATSIPQAHVIFFCFRFLHPWLNVAAIIIYISVKIRRNCVQFVTFVNDGACECCTSLSNQCLIAAAVSEAVSRNSASMPRLNRLVTLFTPQVTEKLNKLLSKHYFSDTLSILWPFSIIILAKII